MAKKLHVQGSKDHSGKALCGAKMNNATAWDRNAESCQKCADKQQKLHDEWCLRELLQNKIDNET